MEFRLNKIDPEVRERVKETTSSGKVHSKSSTVINKDNKEEKERGNSEFNSKLKNEKQKKIFSVDAVKIDEVEIPAYKEETGTFSKDETRGSVIDVKK
ncbi:hypothetical protein [Clostridium sp. DJ247]|uniref:hypothetical protein n=1 Tax=Clostridium sp. DJ247 TaxID=2726188 RepID=UPI00162745F1|nr:hypothetical protein [Clostridium sp. DJ247]MBC2582583.1 hypothetical protein [Clostridium sp. DJ247]